jgi:hypothetical protein
MVLTIDPKMNLSLICLFWNLSFGIIKEAVIKYYQFAPFMKICYVKWNNVLLAKVVLM